MVYARHVQAASTGNQQLTCLQLGNDAGLLHLRQRLLEREGVTLQNIAQRNEFERSIARVEPDVLVVDWTISFDDRRMLAEQAKRTRPECVIMAFHASARNDDWVDCACDSRRGLGILMSAWNQCLNIAQLRRHGHAELEEEYVFVADAHRKYVYASPAALSLLGFTLPEMLSMTVDDLTFPRTEIAPAMFEEFKRTGIMEGDYVLRKRSGEPLRIRFKATALDDGCLVSRWQPA
ncbi:MAG: PAS domain-containing protein [Acidobacteriales bacterium]|nr:PAS domain-containing protein [Terriglobales bacterium]